MSVGSSRFINLVERDLYLSILKYGVDNFDFSILKEIEISENTQKELDYYEDYYITKYNSMDRNFGFNKKTGGGRGKHSEESKEKNRLSHIGKSVNKGVKKSDEAKKNMSLHHADVSGDKNPMFGKSHSDDALDKMSDKAKLRIGDKNPFFGKHHTKETIDKIQIKRFEKKSKYVIICHNNNKTYYSLRDAEKDTQIDRKKISKICNGKMDSYKGYKFYKMNNKN